VAVPARDFWLGGRAQVAARRLTWWSQRIRPWHLFVGDGLGTGLAAAVTLLAWRHELPSQAAWGLALVVIAVVVLAQSATNLLLGLYASSWRFIDVRAAGRILACALAGTVAAALVLLAVGSLRPGVAAGLPPATFWALQATLTLGVLATPRLLIRYASERLEREERSNGRQRTLLYGAGWAGAIVARSAQRDPGAGVTPVGFLDDDPGLEGARVGGLPVFGDLSAMAVAQRMTGASALLMTQPHSTGAGVRRAVDAANEHGLSVRTVPAMSELPDGTIDVWRARPLRAEDLRRGPIPSDYSAQLDRLATGQTVVITGAAGQIGSALVRQMLALRPDRIVMVDQAARALDILAGELQHVQQVIQGSTTITSHLVDVSDREAIASLIRRTRPEVILHAAALAHEPMLEEHAAHATRVNIGGTKALVDAAVDCGVGRFMLVSTDKAGEPSSVMGSSMRIAEMVVRDAARRTGSVFASVRFGELLEPGQSTVLAVRAQLHSGQLATVRDSELRCYAMGPPEASRLILEATARTEPGCLYLLDRGAPVPIEDVARDLVRLSGRDPGRVPIKVVGSGPGSRLRGGGPSKEIDATPTDIPNLLRSVAAQATPLTIEADVERFLLLARDGRDDVLRADLLRYVRSTPVVDARPVARGRDGLMARVPVRSSGKPDMISEHGAMKRPVVIRVEPDATHALADRSGPHGAPRT
jgi:FlaA1/EpsC-like NDP-sugar epimerase